MTCSMSKWVHVFAWGIQWYDNEMYESCLETLGIYEIMPHDMKVYVFLLPEFFLSFQNPGIGLTARNMKKCTHRDTFRKIIWFLVWQSAGITSWPNLIAMIPVILMDIPNQLILKMTDVTSVCSNCLPY